MPHTPVRPGAFCWFELATTNQDSAKDFYRALFGWDIQDDDMGPMGVYTRFQIGGKDVAAASTLQKDQLAHGVPPNWLIYIMVTDADASAAKVTAAGGTVVAGPFDVDTHGRMAIISDPAGAMFAIWQPKATAGVGVTGVPHTVGWADLSTPNAAAAAKFYGDVFGWKTAAGKNMAPAGPDDYAHIMNGADMIGGIPPASQQQPGVPPHWMIYFEVTSCDTMVAKAKALGASVFVDTMAIGENGSIAVLADREGAVFAFHQA
jgi:predicted enzyme related to lactoylglutathione lyase